MPYTVLVEKLDLHNQTIVIQLHKYFPSCRSLFPHKLFKMFVALTYFFPHFATLWNTLKYITSYAYVVRWFVCIKGKLVLLRDKTEYCPQETRSKLIDNQNINFHFHFKLFYIKAMHLSNKLWLTCPQLWPIENICIGLYVLKRLLKVRHIFAKVASMQQRFKKKKTKESWIEVCLKRVLDEW